MTGVGPQMVVSGREESSLDAPAIVRVYTQDDIRQLGLRTLSDVIRITPGFTMITDVDDQVVGTRGIVSDNNSKFVILLNGHNLTSSFNQGINPNHLFPMTLENVKRIEVLTGSGSVLWGSGALLGVFNIVTEDAESLVAERPSNVVSTGVGSVLDEGDGDATARAPRSTATQVGGGFGNQQTYRAFAQHADTGSLAGENASLYASGKFYTSNGTENGKTRFDVGADPLDIDSRLYDFGASYEAMGVLSWSDFTFTARALDLPDNRDQNQPHVSERSISNFLELAWNGHPTETLKTHATVYGDWWRQAKSFRDANEEIRQFDQVTGGSNVLADWFISAQHRLSLGGELERNDYQDHSRRSPTPTGKRILPFADVEGAIFGQYDWTPTEWLGLTGGLRYTGSEHFDDSVDPKAAIRIRPTDSVQLKYIFQKAFLHPSAFQSHAVVTLPSGSPFTPEDIPGFQQDQLEIENERTLSHELQLRWQPSEVFATSVTGSYRELDNLISFNQRKDVAPPRTFTNFGDITAWALEWEGSVRWEKLITQASFSWSDSEFKSGRFGVLGGAGPDGQVLAFPDLMGNVILRYLVSRDLSAAAIVRVIGSSEYFASAPDQLAGVTTSADAYAALDLNLAWQNVGIQGLSFGLTAINVLDESPLLPLAANPGVAFPERLTVYGSVAYAF
jgi:iron complex outermembrane receptor protein